MTTKLRKDGTPRNPSNRTSGTKESRALAGEQTQRDPNERKSPRSVLGNIKPFERTHPELTRVVNETLSDGSVVWDVVGIQDVVFCCDEKDARALHTAIQAAIREYSA